MKNLFNNKIKSFGIFLAISYVILLGIGISYAQSGTYSYNLGNDVGKNSDLKNSILIPSANKNDNFSLIVPAPSVKRTLDTDPYYPDATYVKTNSVSNLKENITDTLSTINGSTSKCGSNQCSIIESMNLSYLIGQNISSQGNSSYLISDNSVSKFKSLFDQGVKTQGNQIIAFEMCYDQGRSILGTQGLSTLSVFPNVLSSGDVYKCTNPLGTRTIGDYKTDLANQFTKQDNVNVLDCNVGAKDGTVSNPFIGTDIFGKPVKGVKTALGCLPSDFSGLFAVILRISIGISSVILLIVIIQNVFTLISGNPSPDKVKTAVGNITRAVQGLLLIIFSVTILSIIGIQVVPLSQLGATGFGRIFGGN